MTSHNHHHGLPYGSRTASSSGSHSFLRKLTSFTKRSKLQPLAASPSYTTAYAPLPTPPSSPPSSSSSVPNRMALAAAKTASRQATANTGLLTPPSTARSFSRPKTAAPGTASSTFSTSRPTTCNAPLVVQVEIRFSDRDGLNGNSSYTNEYPSSQNFEVSNRLCNGLLRRLTHCSTELITRRDSRALMQQLRHGHSVSTKPLSYELHFRIIRKDLGLWADKTFCSYQKQKMSSHDAHEVILATHRMIGLFLRRHDPAFRWSDVPTAQLTSFVSRPEEPELVSHTVGHPLSLSCIPRSRFLDDSQSFEFVPGYAIKLSFRSRCHARKQYEWKRAISLQSKQSAPLSLALAEDLLWNTFESVNSALSVRREAFNNEHKACDFLEGVVSCQHFDEDALDIELKIQNNLGPDYTHLTRSIHSKLALFRHVDGLDCAEFIQNIHSHFVQSREMADIRTSSLPDFDYRITSLKTSAWSLDNPARFVLDASTSYSRRSIEAILDRVETGISDVLRHKGCTIHVVAYKRGHLIVDKSIVTHSRHVKPALFPKSPVEEHADEIVANLKERIHQDINAVCKDTCSLDSLDNIDNLCESAEEARAANIITIREPSLSASPPMTPASATAEKFENTIVLEQSSVIDDEPIMPAPRVVELPDNFYIDDSRPPSPATSTSTRRRAFPLVPEKFILPPSPHPSPPSTPSIVNVSPEVIAVVPAEGPIEAPIQEPIEAPTQEPVEVSVADTVADTVSNAPGQTLLELAEMLAHTLDEIVRDMETPDEPEPFLNAVETPEQDEIDVPVEKLEDVDNGLLDVLAEVIPENAETPEIPIAKLFEVSTAERPVEIAAGDAEELQSEIEAAAEIIKIPCDVTAQVSKFSNEAMTVETPADIPQPVDDMFPNTQNSPAEAECLAPEALIDDFVEQLEPEQEGKSTEQTVTVVPGVIDEATITEVSSGAFPIDDTATSEGEIPSGEDLDETLEKDSVSVVDALKSSSPVIATPSFEDESSEFSYKSTSEDNVRGDTVSENDSSIKIPPQPANLYEPQALFTFDNDSETDAEEQIEEVVRFTPSDDVLFLYNFDDVEEEPLPTDLHFEDEEILLAGAQLGTIFEADDDTSSEFYFDFPAYDQGLPHIPSVDNIQTIVPVKVAPQEAPEDGFISNVEETTGSDEELHYAELVTQPTFGQDKTMTQQDEDFDDSDYSDDEPLMFSSPTRTSRSNPVIGTTSIPTAGSFDHTRPSTPSLSHSSGELNSPEASFLETPKISHDTHPAMITCFDSDNDTRYSHKYDADGKSEPAPHFAVFARDPKPEVDTSAAPVVLGESLLEQPFTAPVSPTLCEISESDSTPTEVWHEANPATTGTEVVNSPSRPALDFSTSTPAFSFELNTTFEDFAATKPDIDLEEFADVVNDESDLEHYNDITLDDAIRDTDADEFQLPSYDRTAPIQQDYQLDMVEAAPVVEANIVEPAGESLESRFRPELIPLPFSDDEDLSGTDWALCSHDDSLSPVTETEPHIHIEPVVGPVLSSLSELAALPSTFIQPEVVDILHSHGLDDKFSHENVDELALFKGGAPSEDANVNSDKLVDSEVRTHDGVELIDLDSEISPESESDTSQAVQVSSIESIELDSQPPNPNLETGTFATTICSSVVEQAIVPILETLPTVADVSITCELAVLSRPPQSEDEEQYVLANTTITSTTSSESTTTQVCKVLDTAAPHEDITGTATKTQPLLSAADLSLGLDSMVIPSPPAVDIDTVEELPLQLKSATPEQLIAKSVCEVNIVAPVSAARHSVSWFLPKSGLVGLDESRLIRVGLRGALTGSRAFDNLSSVASGLHLRDTQATIDDDIDLSSADEVIEEAAPTKYEEPSFPEQIEETLPEKEPSPTTVPLAVVDLPQAATITKVEDEPKPNQDVILPRVIMAFASMAVISQMINRSSSN